MGSKPEVKVDGELGKLLSIQGLLLNVTRIQAESGQEFLLVKQSKLAAIESVKSNLSVGDVGKDTGILAFNYVGVDKNKIQNILNSIVKNTKKPKTLRQGRSGRESGYASSIVMNRLP